LSVYFDASLIVSIVLPDALSARADAYIRRDSPTPVISDFAAAEFTADELDVWRSAVATACGLSSEDVAAANSFLRRLDLTLRAPDALHLAIARRLHVPVATSDVRMADAARAVGLEIAPA
jgi:hypothetical protein